MYTAFVFIVAFTLGAISFWGIILIDTKLDAYRDRKQAEFEAAVQAAADHRLNQSTRGRYPSNVNRYAFEGTDDPFGGV